MSSLPKILSLNLCLCKVQWDLHFKTLGVDSHQWACKNWHSTRPNPHPQATNHHHAQGSVWKEFSNRKGENNLASVEGSLSRLLNDPCLLCCVYSGVMDKQVLRSFLNPANINKYAVGVLKNGKLVMSLSFSCFFFYELPNF